MIGAGAAGWAMDDIWKGAVAGHGRGTTLKVHAPGTREAKFLPPVEWVFGRNGRKANNPVDRQVEQAPQYAGIVAIHQPSYLRGSAIFTSSQGRMRLISLTTFGSRRQATPIGCKSCATDSRSVADAADSPSFRPGGRGRGIFPARLGSLRHLDALRGAYARAESVPRGLAGARRYAGAGDGAEAGAANRHLIELIAAQLGLRARFHAASGLGIGADDADAAGTDGRAACARWVLSLRSRRRQIPGGPAVFAAVRHQLAYTDFRHPAYPRNPAPVSPRLEHRGRAVRRGLGGDGAAGRGRSRRSRHAGALRRHRGRIRRLLAQPVRDPAAYGPQRTCAGGCGASVPGRFERAMPRSA